MLGERIKEQVERAKKVQEATLSLTPEQQAGMVDRYNKGNPQKKPVTVKEFLQILDEEVKSQEARLEQERRSLLNTQQRNLYTAQFIQSSQCFLGAAAFVLLFYGRAGQGRSVNILCGKVRAGSVGVKSLL